MIVIITDEVYVFCHIVAKYQTMANVIVNLWRKQCYRGRFDF